MEETLAGPEEAKAMQPVAAEDDMKEGEAELRRRTVVAAEAEMRQGMVAVERWPAWYPSADSVGYSDAIVPQELQPSTALLTEG
ncbi:hypothetical protein H5398_08530 [Tessaracoccus sp. MC1679]|uniref:hypothetical protein n=1 Tax=Tessaracoccus sp. MC1679 TaxID=2760313 RepID=UPI001601F489|nr:hypothetical protein [Tessaracoccus sp. MC1679]MBB1516011.1 hypothetical protein [Tessaracoccus sp. MC1679]